MPNKSLRIAKKYIGGNLRCVEFGLTNTCLAKCSFCDIWKQKPKVFVDTGKALEAIDKMAGLGVSHITLTGGEPLMHPDITDIVLRASRHGIHNAVLNAAPRLMMKDGLLKKLEEAGNDLISISFDSGDPEIMAESRKIDNIMAEMENALEMIKRTSLKTMASVLIWKDNYDKLEAVCDKAKSMGFDFISFNYPTFSQSDVYVLGGDGIDFPAEKVIEGLESAIRLKNSGKYGIINPAPSMQNIINYLKNPDTVKYLCFGGSRVFFVDWFFNVYPCMQLNEPMGSIFDITQKQLDRTPCNACSMSWYHDISIFFHGLRSIPVLISSVAASGKML